MDVVEEQTGDGKAGLVGVMDSLCSELTVFVCSASVAAGISISHDLYEIV